MRPARPLVWILLVALPVAGCVGSSGVDPAGPGEDDDATLPVGDDAADAVPPDGPRVARFDAEPVDRTVWANGSVPFHRTQPRSWIDGSDETVLPLDDHVPAGVPVRVNASVSWQEDAVNEMMLDNIDLDLDAPPSAVQDVESNDESAPMGSEYLAVTFARSPDQSVGLIVETQWATLDTELNWTLRIDVQVDPAVVPAGSVVAVPTEPGRTLRLVPVDERVEALAFGPGDRVLGHVDATEPVPVPGSEPAVGEVVLAFARSGRIEVSAGPDDGPAGSLRTVTTVDQATDPHPVPADGTPVEWSVETDQPPVAVALVVVTQEPIGAYSGTVQGTIVGPEGPVVEVETACGLCIPGGGNALASTWSGTAPGDGATTFDASVRADLGVNLEAWHVVRTYER